MPAGQSWAHHTHIPIYPSIDQLEKKKFLEILGKYNSGNASEEEIAFLDAYYKSCDIRADLISHLDEPERTHFKTELRDSITDKISRYENEKGKKNNKIIFRLAVSVAAAIIIVISALYYYPQQPKTELAQNKISEKDIEPGGNKALLTLSNGQKISLTDAGIGTLAKQAGVKITKTADGQLVYTVLDGSQGSVYGDSQFNTIETPQGGQYRVRLPDGSDVWLNAASALTYPSNFTAGKTRNVDLKGEAYFEIAKDRTRPFIVKTSTQEVEVLGTHFNINAYADEPAVKTTLLEGSVKVNGLNGKRKLLIPGQQSVLTASNMQVAKIDTDLAVAWKNNQFVFESDDIRYIMRMVARWYNVEVEYAGPIPENKFGGAVSRFENVSEVLNSLESTGKVNFKLLGKRIIVSK